MKLTATLIIFIFFSLVTSSWAGPSEILTCRKQLIHLKDLGEQVAELDGIWGLFQKRRELQGNSALSINLDRSVNSIIFHLEFLCDTIDGISFDELSDYVAVSLAEKKAKLKYGLSFPSLLSQTGIELWIPKRFLTLSRCHSHLSRAI